MSTWIFFEPGANSDSLPVTRSSKRAPMLIMTSQLYMARFASYVPCMPSMPNHCGSDAGKAPRPIRVEVIGKPVSFTNCVSSFAAKGPAFTTPPPV